MDDVAWEVPERIRDRYRDHLPSKSSFGEKACACGLCLTWHNHEAVPVMLFGVAPGPFRFASRVVGDIDEAHDRNPGHFGTRRVVAR